MINVKKFCVVRYTKRKSPIFYHYRLCDMRLSIKNSEMKDLKIQFVLDGTFYDQLLNTINMFRCIFGFTNRNSKTLKSIYIFMFIQFTCKTNTRICCIYLVLQHSNYTARNKIYLENL